MGEGVVHVEDQGIAGALRTIDVLLGVHVFRHVPVPVQVVGGQVGDDGDVGAQGEVHELEGAELHHGEVRRVHLLRQGQEGGADVAAQPDLPARLLQQPGDQGGGGRLAVGAGDGDDGAGAHPEEGLHLGGDLRARFAQGGELGPVRLQAGGAEDHVAGQILQIVRPCLQAAAPGLQGEHLLLQLFIGRGVAAGDVAAMLQQHAHQGPVADAQTEHQDFFAGQGIEPGVDLRIHSEPLFRSFSSLYSFLSGFAMRLTNLTSAATILL